MRRWYEVCELVFIEKVSKSRLLVGRQEERFAEIRTRPADSLTMASAPDHQNRSDDYPAKPPMGRQSPTGDRPNMSTRIVLVGKTGAGKSSSGNTILGVERFHAAKGFSSITKECRKEMKEVAGRMVAVVDTPGLFDTSLTKEEMQLSIQQCINMTSPGPHAIILVIQLGPFTEEERLSVERARAIFGEEAGRYTMILFTHADELTSSIEETLSTAPQDLKHILSLCRGQYHSFDNTNVDNRAQVEEFLEKVDAMVAANGGDCYCSTVYQEAESLLREKEEQLWQGYNKTLQDLLKDQEIQFDDERRQLLVSIETLRESEQQKEMKIKELELLVQSNNRKLDEYKCYYEEKLRCVRQEAEQTQNLPSICKIMEKLISSFCSTEFVTSHLCELHGS